MSYADTAADHTIVVQSGTRATGYGDYPAGLRFNRPTKVTQVVIEAGTADASGTNTVALYKGTGGATGTALTGGTPSGTLTATSAYATLTLSGNWVFAAGEYLQVNVTAVGTTPGAKLRAHVKASHDPIS